MEKEKTRDRTEKGLTDRELSERNLKKREQTLRKALERKFPKCEVKLTEEGWIVGKPGETLQDTSENKPKTEPVTDIPQVTYVNKDKNKIKATGLLRNSSIKITVEAKKEDWERMIHRYPRLSIFHTDQIGDNLSNDFLPFIQEVYYFINPPEEKRAGKVESPRFVRQMKVQAALTYTLMRYWYKTKEKSPEALRNIRSVLTKELIKEELLRTIDHTPGHIPNSMLKEFYARYLKKIDTPEYLTAYMLQKIYDISWEENGIKPFVVVDDSIGLNDIKTFVTAYIDRGKELIQYALSFSLAEHLNNSTEKMSLSKAAETKKRLRSALTQGLKDHWKAYEHLMDDLNSITGYLKCYKLGQEYYKRDARILNLLLAIMEAATLNYDGNATATAEVKQIQQDIEHNFPGLTKQSFR
jgi:hypothetical protein